MTAEAHEDKFRHPSGTPRQAISRTPGSTRRSILRAWGALWDSRRLFRRTFLDLVRSILFFFCSAIRLFVMFVLGHVDFLFGPIKQLRGLHQININPGEGKDPETLTPSFSKC